MPGNDHLFRRMPGKCPEMTIYQMTTQRRAPRAAEFRFRDQTEAGPAPNANGAGTKPEPKAETIKPKLPAKEPILPPE